MTRKEDSGGYCSQRYAESLHALGQPLVLPGSGGWLLARSIARREDQDAVGCYPVFCCHDWSALGNDVTALDGRLVSICVVTDPFGSYDEGLLRSVFPHLVRPFKPHYIVDLQGSGEPSSKGHHRRNALRALKSVSVERLDEPAKALDTWCSLYEELIRRHQIHGFARFSRASFSLQLQVPGLIALCARARADSETVGMILWYVQGNKAYYHLAAYSERGYVLKASFALFWESFTLLRELGIAVADLGSMPGLAIDESHGLARFKKGWSTGTRPTYLCGRISDPQRYRDLVGSQEGAGMPYFPAYRRPLSVPK